MHLGTVFTVLKNAPDRQWTPHPAAQHQHQHSHQRILWGNDTGREWDRQKAWAIPGHQRTTIYALELLNSLG